MPFKALPALLYIKTFWTLVSYNQTDYSVLPDDEEKAKRDAGKWWKPWVSRPGGEHQVCTTHCYHSETHVDQAPCSKAQWKGQPCRVDTAPCFNAVENNCGYHLFESDSEEEEEEVTEKKEEEEPTKKKSAFQVAHSNKTNEQWVLNLS